MTRPDWGRHTIGDLCLLIAVMITGADHCAGQVPPQQPVLRNQPADPQLLELPSDWLPASFAASGNDDLTDK